MRQFGLIGNPLSHSLSPAYFSEKWKREGVEGCRYSLFPLASIAEFPLLWVQHPELKGLNVTSPYKQEVLACCDRIREDAAAIGATNVVFKDRDGRITACNTDHLGFLRLLENCSLPIPQALVLGSGGAAKAVAYCLKQKGIPFLNVSRKARYGSLTYAEISAKVLQECPLVVNATPLGMGKWSGQCPDIPYEALSPKHILIDLIYSPEESLFLRKGREKGCETHNGLPMLHAQADASWEIWRSL
ncbi:MAG: shikimate dehydrogenase [Bacteroidales bacterium]|nr:shikimate dehydrogenase [Bacteroidales bacterium]